MNQKAPKPLSVTGWQTVGPFFHYALPWQGGADLVGVSTLGARTELMPLEHYLLKTPSPRGPVAGRAIEIVGRVIDGDGAGVPDALIETWQANAAGEYCAAGDASGFIGFGRSATSNDGTFRFRTIVPGRVAGPGNLPQAPHIAIGVLGRGLLRRLTTRLYFPDGEGLADDPILNLVPAARRHTLIAARDGEAYRFDIVLQGENETVFFDC